MPRILVSVLFVPAVDTKEQSGESSQPILKKNAY